MIYHPVTFRIAPCTGRLPRISATSCGVRVDSVRLTSKAISYPMSPTSQEESATTANTDPSETLIINKNSESISTMRSEERRVGRDSRRGGATCSITKQVEDGNR